MDGNEGNTEVNETPRHGTKSKRPARRIAAGVVLCFCAGAVAFWLNPEISLRLLMTETAPVHDTFLVSPDSAYVATVREIDTGAVGSGSVILLKSRWGVFPRLGKGSVADGPPQFFGPVRWSGDRTLRVVFGASGPPDPSWTTKWRDVSVIYIAGEPPPQARTTPEEHR